MVGVFFLLFALIFMVVALLLKYKCQIYENAFHCNAPCFLIQLRPYADANNTLSLKEAKHEQQTETSSADHGHRALTTNTLLP